MAKLNDDCFILDKDRIAHREALVILEVRVCPRWRPTFSMVEQPDVLPATASSPRPIPAHDNAAVDCYASPTPLQQGGRREIDRSGRSLGRPSLQRHSPTG